MRKPADWLAWCLQFICGLLVGGFVGFRLMSEGAMPTDGRGGAFFAGTALIGAALASRYGDRLWIGDSYRVIPPDEPRSNHASRMVSLLAGLIGCVVLIFALLGK